MNDSRKSSNIVQEAYDLKDIVSFLFEAARLGQHANEEGESSYAQGSASGYWKTYEMVETRFDGLIGSIVELRQSGAR